LPEITDGYETQLHHSLGHDLDQLRKARSKRQKTFMRAVIGRPSNRLRLNDSSLPDNADDHPILLHGSRSLFR
ncbi:hypothetical protein, partial [Neorhizobium galegae]|uniref:hypothetical protein n=1 Tax=Neorhizobium galegae TaxID=399 RepID=UPI002035163F